MKVYGLEIPENTGGVTNLTVPLGTAFPAEGNAGELFFRTDDGILYIHNSVTWQGVIVAGSSGGSLSVEGGVDIDAYIGTGSPTAYVIDIAYPLNEATDGSVTAPTYSFGNETTTGMYRSGTNEIGFTVGGTQYLHINTTEIQATVPFVTEGGSATTPSYSFSVDTDVGMYRPTSDTLSFATNGTERIQITNTSVSFANDVILGANATVTSGDINITSGDINLSFGTLNVTNNVISGSPPNLVPLAVFETIGSVDGGVGDEIEIKSYRPGIVLRDKSTSSDDFKISVDNNYLKISVDTDEDDARTTSGFFDDNENALTVSSGGFIGFNTADSRSAEAGSLHIYTGDSGFSGNVSSTGDDLVVENNAAGGITILTPNTYSGSVYFGDPEDSTRGSIGYAHSSDTLVFRTSGSITMDLTDTLLDTYAAIRSFRPSYADQYIEIKSPDAGGHVLFGSTLESNKKPMYFRNSHDNSGSASGSQNFIWQVGATSSLTEVMRLYDVGILCIGTTDQNPGNNGAGGEEGVAIQPIFVSIARSSGAGLYINRMDSDGNLLLFYQDGTLEGSVSVSGTTVTYGGGHLARWSQLPGGGIRQDIPRGTVMSSVQEMCEWWYVEVDGKRESVEPGTPGAILEDNEQLTRSKPSDMVGDKTVSGIFDRWDDDDETNTTDMILAETGDFVIRVTGPCNIGDFVESNGDGTARVQASEFQTAATIAKITFGAPNAGPQEENTLPCLLKLC